MVSPLPAAAASAGASLTTVLQSSVVPLIAAAGGTAEPGTVDAPGWVLPAGAVAVILTAGLIPLLLKVGACVLTQTLAQNNATHVFSRSLLVHIN